MQSLPCFLWAACSESSEFSPRCTGVLPPPLPMFCCAPEPTPTPWAGSAACTAFPKARPPHSITSVSCWITPVYPQTGQPSLVWWQELSWLLCFFQPTVPRSFGFAVLFGVQAQECLLLKSLLPSSTDLLEPGFWAVFLFRPHKSCLDSRQIC